MNCGYVASRPATGVLSVGSSSLALKKEWSRRLVQAPMEIEVCSLSVRGADKGYSTCGLPVAIAERAWCIRVVRSGECLLARASEWDVGRNPTMRSQIKVFCARRCPRTIRWVWQQRTTNSTLVGVWLRAERVVRAGNRPDRKDLSCWLGIREQWGLQRRHQHLMVERSASVPDGEGKRV